MKDWMVEQSPSTGWRGVYRAMGVGTHYEVITNVQ